MIQFAGFECVGRISIPLIQCNGFWSSGEGLSENAATGKCSYRPKMKLLLISPHASGQQVGTIWNFKTLASIQ